MSSGFQWPANAASSSTTGLSSSVNGNGALQPSPSPRGSRDQGGGQINRFDVHVQNIPLDMNEEQVEDIFVACGNVLSVRVLPPKDQRTTVVGFVSFASEEEANAAIERLDGCQAGQSTLRVTKAIPREKPLGLSGPTAESKVHIVNIPLQMSQDELRDAFGQCGNVTSVRILPPKEDRTSTIGFVGYSNEKEANSAIEQLNGYQTGGCTLRVSKAMARDGGSRASGMTAPSPSEPKVHVMNIPLDMSEENFRAIFAECGEVASVKILPPKDGRTSTIGFVSFVCEEAVNEAIGQLNGFQAGDCTLKVSRARGRQETPAQTGAMVSPFGSRPQQSPAVNGQSGLPGHGISPFQTSPPPASSHNIPTNPPQLGLQGAPGRVSVSATLLPNQPAASFSSLFSGQNNTVNHQTESRQFLGFSSLREVNTNRGPGNAASNNCHKCGESGHFARDCRSEGGNTCHRCGMAGHFARECPSGGNQSGGSTCHKCGEVGHFARECPSGGNQSGGSTCHKCGEVGHFARECPSGGNQSGGSMCHRCGEVGHFARECSTDTNQGGGRGCHKCGEVGHFARECPNALSLDGKSPAPVTYIPPDLPENADLLFENVPHSGINFEKYDEIPVEVTGVNPPPPIQSFEQAGMYEQCAANIRRAKFPKPTPVQKYTIPIVNSGRDLMACAQTGSGKTVAFLIPVLTGMLQHGLVSRSSLSGEVQEPMALCIAPTRELARQIHKESCKFSLGTVMRAVVCYGGVSVSHQLQDIERGCHFLIATPGRLEDFINRGKISLASIRYLILDEADRMLDMGFEPVIRKIVQEKGMPSKHQRQTIMLSATFPDQIQHLAADFLKEDYLFCAVGRVGGTNTDISQHIVRVEGDEKRNKLFEILQQSGTDRTLVFVELKRVADFLACVLSQNQFPTTSISSDRSQQEREQALEDFRTGRAPIMVATSVAARGLDVADVKHVINYDLPQVIEDYVHRIGRTGRIGNKGKATSFYEAGRDEKIARSLVKVLAEASQVVPDWLEYAAEEAIGSSYGPAGGKFASRDRRQRFDANKEFSRQGAQGVTEGMAQMSLQNGGHFQQPAPGPAPVSCGGGNDDEDWD